jgi:hypothetical protein
MNFSASETVGAADAGKARARRRKRDRFMGVRIARLTAGGLGETA